MRSAPQKKTRRTKPGSPPRSAPTDPARAFAGIVADRIVLTPIASLRVSRHQARSHDEKQIALIMGSFERFGFVNPIIADASGEIIAGAARYEAAVRLGINSVPVVLATHLTADEKRAYRLADNRIALLAGWDTKALAIEFEHLITIDFDLGSLGFEVPEIDLVLMGENDEELDEADDPVAVDPAGTAVVRLGDVFRLGRHRLLCGDAMDPGSYATLMEGVQARMALSDPPFNCPIDGFVGGLGKVKHREFAMATGEMSREEFKDFLVRFYQNSGRHLVDGGLVYAFMDWRQQLPLLLAADEAGLTHVNTCVWNKLTGGMGSFYRSQHEFCAVHKKGSQPHLNCVELGRHGRYRTNVWDHQGMAGFSRERDELLASHPTVKPWALLAEAIRDCTRQGDVVLDPFLGSGSTLIAAERSGRVCRGIELDPTYCEVIIARFETLTGAPVVHEATGMTFGELKVHRQEMLEAQPDEGNAAPPLDSRGQPDETAVPSVVSPAIEHATASASPQVASSIKPADVGTQQPLLIRQRRRPSPAATAIQAVVIGADSQAQVQTVELRHA